MTPVTNAASLSKRKASIPFESYTSFKIKEMWWGIRQEPWAFWFLCLYLMFEYTRLQSIYPWLGIIPWLQLSLLATLVAIVSGKEKKWVKSGATWPLVIFVIHTLVSSLFAYEPSVSFEYMNTMLNWLLLYYCILVIATTRKRLFIILLLIILATFKMTNSATLQFVMRGFAFERWGIAGPPGWFGDAADLSLQVLIYIALVVALILYTRSKTEKWVQWVFMYMVLSGFITIIAAGNRGTIVALAAMVGFILLFLKNRFRNFFVLFLLGGVLFLASPAEFKERFTTAGSDNTSATRLLQWERGWQAAKDYPVLGIGYNNWKVYMPDRYYGGVDTKFVAHSAPFTVLGELGFVGFFWYFCVNLAVFVINKKTERLSRAKNDKLSEYLSISLNVGLVAYTFAGLFISVNYYPFLYVQLALTAALNNIVKNQPLPLSGSGTEKVSGVSD